MSLYESARTFTVSGLYSPEAALLPAFCLPVLFADGAGGGAAVVAITEV